MERRSAHFKYSKIFLAATPLHFVALNIITFIDYITHHENNFFSRVASVRDF